MENHSQEDSWQHNVKSMSIHFDATLQFLKIDLAEDVKYIHIFINVSLCLLKFFKSTTLS